MQVPFRIPCIRRRRSPATPSRSPRRIGIPPATAASNSRWRPCRPASRNNAGPLWAMTCLLAVTTDLPAASACSIQLRAGSCPPINSTITSTGLSISAWKELVQITSPPAQSTRLRATFRLQTCVSCTPGWAPLARMRATARPTVPKPAMPTVHSPGVGRLAITTFMCDCAKKNHHPVQMMACGTLLVLRLHHPLCPRGAGAMVKITTGTGMFVVIACTSACDTPWRRSVFYAARHGASQPGVLSNEK